MIPRTVTAAAGEELTIRVESNPTTGYVWKIHALPEDIELVSSEYQRSTGPSPPGRPGTQIFRFRAARAGQYIIEWTLERPWEKQPIDSLQVTVDVT